MSSEITDSGFIVDGALEREQALVRRAVAYACFMVAAWIVEAVACFLLLTPRLITDMLSASFTDAFWMLLLPGPAAALGAAAVHIPFMRALKAGRRRFVHGWAVTGVLAAHAVYAMLVFLSVLVLSLLPNHHYLLLADQPNFSATLSQALDATVAAGLAALALGFLPNVLFAEGFAAFMVRRHKERKAADPASAIQSILEITRHEFAKSAD